MARLRKAARESGSITAATALDFEQDGWPAARTRNEFWSRDEVPAALRPGSAPDPRIVLSGEYADVRAFTAAQERWARARIKWLRAQARGRRP